MFKYVPRFPIILPWHFHDIPILDEQWVYKEWNGLYIIYGCFPNWGFQSHGFRYYKSLSFDDLESSPILGNLHPYANIRQNHIWLCQAKYSPIKDRLRITIRFFVCLKALNFGSTGQAMNATSTCHSAGRCWKFQIERGLCRIQQSLFPLFGDVNPEWDPTIWLFNIAIENGDL